MLNTLKRQKFIEVIKGNNQFFYKLKTDEDITIETLYSESVLEFNN
jgi:hypothetical protein